MTTTPRYPRLALHVGGEWLTRASGRERGVYNPADESPLGMLPLAGPTELAAAADAAQRGGRALRARTAH